MNHKITVPLLDLARQHQPLEKDFMNAFKRVLGRQRFLNGPEIETLESEFAAWCEQPQAVACSSGSTALYIALKTLGIGPGDEVITTPFTFIATVEAIRLAGAMPVFVDVDPRTGLMNIEQIETALTPKTAAVLFVHLYGQPGPMSDLRFLCDRYGLALIEDAAQAHGAAWEKRRVGFWGDMACFSFYPTKNLGGLGDGGMIVTRDTALAERARRIRNHGREGHYYHVEFGFNFRMNEIQAALLRAKLPHLNEWIRKRNVIVLRYHREVQNPHLTWICTLEGATPAWHLATLRTPSRDRLQQWLTNHRIGHAVHYPRPLHQQPALRSAYRAPVPLTGAEQLASEVLSVPLFPELAESEVDYIIDVLNAFQPES